MIPSSLAPEPPHFAVQVKAKGDRYLRTNPRPTAAQFKKHAYWKASLPSLKTSYRNICAFSSFWIPGQCSVDHFVPKSSRPDLAYKWSNYRLAMDRINSNKGDDPGILDPFKVQVGWFALDLANLFVTPGDGLIPSLRSQVLHTITTLKLNDDVWVETRFEIFRDYLDGNVALEFLERRYPFIAAEIVRQTT